MSSSWVTRAHQTESERHQSCETLIRFVPVEQPPPHPKKKVCGSGWPGWSEVMSVSFSSRCLPFWWGGGWGTWKEGSKVWSDNEALRLLFYLNHSLVPICPTNVLVGLQSRNALFAIQSGIATRFTFFFFRREDKKIHSFYARLSRRPLTHTLSAPGVCT